MYGRTGGLDRFKKAQSSEPFSVTTNNSNNNSAAARSIITNNYSPNYQAAAAVNNNNTQHQQQQQQQQLKAGVVDVASSSVAAVGGGQSSWQPPDWAMEPRPGMYYLEVLKEGVVLDRINLDRRRHIFGRQLQTCDFVLDHTSVSRQHAAVVPHKNGSIYVIDLGSAHGTFVANERLTKNSPVELEAGQSLRFAASTRTYILRKNEAALFPPPLSPSQIKLPPPPDPSDEDAILTYNTFLNRYGLLPQSNKRTNTISADSAIPTKKRARKMKVGFRDQVGGDLIEVVGFSDGADVETEPGPVGVKEGSLVGKYASLVQTTVIPKGKEETSSSSAAAAKETNINNCSTVKKGVTDKLQQILDKVKNGPPRSGMYEDLYGDSFSGKVGSSWAAADVSKAAGGGALSGKLGDNNNNNNNSSSTVTYNDDDDDLFGD